MSCFGVIAFFATLGRRPLCGPEYCALYPGSGSRHQCGAENGQAALRGADMSLPVQSGFASRGRGTVSAGHGAHPQSSRSVLAWLGASADCVRGLARLISSAISSWVKTGPGIKRNSRLPLAFSSKTSEPKNVARHQIGRELHPLVIQTQNGAERFNEKRFRQIRAHRRASAWPPERMAEMASSTTAYLVHKRRCRCFLARCGAFRWPRLRLFLY